MKNMILDPLSPSKRVPVLSDDTPEILAERVLAAEHELLPRVVAEAARQLVRGEQIKPMSFES